MFALTCISFFLVFSRSDTQDISAIPKISWYRVWNKWNGGPLGWIPTWLWLQTFPPTQPKV